MAWNVPGGSGGDKDPWGQRRKPGQSPDLDQIVRNIQQRLGGLFGGRRAGGGGGGARSFGIGLILLVAAGVWLLSGFYIIQQGERGSCCASARRSA